MKEQNEEELKQNGSEIQEETSAHSDNADKMAEQEQQTEAEVKADETQPETAPEKEKTTEEKLQEAEEEIALCLTPIICVGGILPCRRPVLFQKTIEVRNFEKNRTERN